MTTAQIILISSGLACLFIGAFSGIPMGLIRATQPTVPKYLTMVHLSGYGQAPILIALGLAIANTTSGDFVAVGGAAVLSFSAFLLILKDFINWRQDVKDEFAEKTIGLMMGNIFGPLHIIGLALCTIAIVNAF